MRKLISRLFATFTILCLLVPYANVKAIDVGSVGGISTGGVTAAASTAMNSIMNNLGVNQDALKNQVSSLNVSQNKEQPPQVMIEFSPANPTEGEQVTATASTMYFLNDASKQYYTWYIQRGGCETGPVNSKTASCDLNGSGYVNVEDYKIAAARIMVTDGFDWNRAMGSDNPNCSTGAATKPDYCSMPDLYQSPPSIQQNYDQTPPIGGADQEGKTNPCFVYGTSSGNIFQLGSDGCRHLFPGKYAMDAGENVRSINNGGYLSGEAQGDKERFWHTDPNNADTGGNGQTNESAITGVGRNTFTWTYKSGDKVGVVVEGVYVIPTQLADSSYKTMWAIPDESCVDANVNQHAFTPDYAYNTDGTVCNPADPTAGTPFAAMPTTLPSATCTETQQALSGHDNTSSLATTNTTITTTTVKTYACTWTPTSGIDPSGPGRCTYPGYPDTPDSTNVTGPTTANATSSDYSIDSSNPVEACLEDHDGLNKNLLAPTEGGTATKILLSLSALPASPINDPLGTNSDTLSVASSVLNANDPAALQYSWQVYTGDDIASDNWNGPLLKQDLPDSSPTYGVGLSNFKFKLAFPEPTAKYIKITLRVTENAQDQAPRTAYAETIVPLASNSDTIDVYDVSPSAANQGAVTMGTAKRCTDGADRIICPVVKDEIVGLKASSGSLTNILWSIDGKAIAPIGQGCLSGDCKAATGEPTNIAYFPVLKENGDQYSVNLTADKASGDKLNITRTFTVTEPAVVISSNDTSTCKPEYLGSYVDLNGKQWPDYSNTSFVALTGSTVSLKPTLNMPFVQSVKWFIDGTEATSLGAQVAADGTLSFTANKLPGQPYAITYSAVYSQDSNIKKILNTSFNVPMNAFYETPVSANIQVTMASSFSASVADNGSVGHKILASLVTDVPAYITFLFRIVVTTLLILLTSWILLSLFPRPQED